MRSGVAASAVAELIDAPSLLAQTESQAFVDQTFRQIEKVAGDAKVERDFTDLRATLRATAAFDRAQALAQFRTATLDLLRVLTPPRDRLFLIGSLAEQTEYNARVLRERAADGELRRQLSSFSEGDVLVPGLDALRARLGALSPENWLLCAQLAKKAVVAILGPDNTPPFPPLPSIWTILLRNRPAGEGPSARAAPHLSLDVVWLDGRHETFGGYPNGGFDFSDDAVRLECLRDHEPDSDVQQSTPIFPPHGFDAAAVSFDHACTAIDQRVPDFVAAEASDDRLIAAMLTGAGIDPASVAPK